MAEFNVVWVPMGGKEFAEEVVRQLHVPAATGIAQFARYRSEEHAGALRIPEVAELATNPMEASDFLLGAEPIWADLQSGRAIAREHDNLVWEIITKALGQETPGLVVVSGTAGSGKSTALMRIALRLVADGKKVGWIDKDVDLSPRDIRAAMNAAEGPEVLAIDDADMYGGELTNIVRELALGARKPLILLAVRSGKIDRVLNSMLAAEIPVEETAVPHLTDADIGALIDTLDRENRLGKLKGKPRFEQEAELRVHAGRQLLVAMLSATSGRPFKEKPVQELNELPVEGRQVYALIAVASAFRFRLSRDEIMMASGDRSNAALNALETLVRRHIVTTAPDGSVKARHRVIADLLMDELRRTGELRDVLEGLAFLAATKVGPAIRRNARPWRMLRAIINHDFLARTIFPEPARNLYASLEQLLSWDYHFWLQRGSLEVEFGSAALAENFLNQARGLAPEDPFVETEWAYLLFRKAIENPLAGDSPELVATATELLEDLIQRPGNSDSYPYHVLGAQGLSWARRGLITRPDRDRFLSKLLAHMTRAGQQFPRSSEIQQLLQDVRQEYLMTTVPSPPEAQGSLPL